MLEGILGRKLGMTQVFDETGNAVPVTVIEAGPCYVAQLKTIENDGYEAVQLGFETAKKLSSAEKGHLKNLPTLRHLKEFKADDLEGLTVGQKIDASLFAEGEYVDVVGTSKGKGFAGVMKRYHFKGGPKTHGQSDRQRSPGSSGATTTPGRVYKGTRRSGHMGAERVSVQNLLVVRVEPDRNLLLVRGAVPGPKTGLLMIKRAESR